MTVASSGLSPAELVDILARTDPSALLVPPRILRRVIKQDCGGAGLGLQVPHYKTCVIGRDALLRIANRAELRLPADRELPETLILMQDPDAGRLRSRPPASVLRVLWRNLFHARIHVAVRARGLDDGAVQERARRLGTAVFNEARAVLRQENFLLPPGDDRTVYEEFAALYLELRSFTPHLLPCYFPAIADFEAVDQLLAEDVNADGLLARTRPEGAAAPGQDVDHETVSAPTDGAPAASGASDVPCPAADQAAARGNDVRAARLYMRAGRRSAALDAVGRLAARLRKALHLSEAESGQWRTALAALLAPAARGRWPIEARLLYDLQRVCIDQEKEIYALDLVEWAVTWGQRPVKRLLPHQPFVLTVKYLRRCLRRLITADLPDNERHLLHRLMEDSLHHAEKRLRQRFRPLIVGALDAVELRPMNYPEKMARDTIVEEMLDRVVERGFITMSDLRDAVARNRLKLPDVANPLELLLGDKLLQANRKLAVALDGVYRRGEIYLRWLQRFSSVFFGTALGRFLVLYLILPLGLGIFAVKGPKLIWDEVRHLSQPIIHLVTGAPTPEHHHKGEHHSPIELDRTDILPIAAASLIVLGLIHSAAFRRGAARVLRSFFWGLGFLLFDLPARLLNTPAVRRLLQSRGYLLIYQFGIKPGIWAALAGLIWWWEELDPGLMWAGVAAVFAVAELALNSRLGMRVEESCTDALVRGWNLLKADILPGLFRRVVAFFKFLLEGLDRLIYTVDEWLRFRTGDSRVSLYVKPVIGLVWFAVTYVVRFAVNLLIEPQINPIKHFPVVTISHKVLLPMTPTVADAFGISNAEAGTLLSGVPGIFGFLVWELKENWKLYAANQPSELRPVLVGSHGETVLRLLRPGFHSGTLPKLYAKLRRSERRSQATRIRKRRVELHHVEEAVRHFVERRFAAVLAGSSGWRRSLYVGAVHAATDQLRVEISNVAPDGDLSGTETVIMRKLVPDSFEIAFEEQSGWLIAGISRPGWLMDLMPTERLVLGDALIGLYKRAGVDVVREQVAAVLPHGASWSIRDDKLMVQEDGRLSAYDMAADDFPWPSMIFSKMPISWPDWVAVWQRDQDGKGHEPPLLPNVRLLP